MAWLAEFWLEMAALVLIAAAVWWLMPGARARSKVPGLLLAILGTAALAWRLESPPGDTAEVVLFFAFAAGAVLSGILMITHRRPVYSALWFAMATLCTCGLFLLQFAPFLAAATVIVYAGAIVVTFVFVIMLAQQSGAAVYDQRSRQPLVATVAAFVLLAALVGTIRATSTTVGPLTADAQSAAIAANPLSKPADGERLGAMHGLGRSLFGDYLYAVELAGTLLLIATIGAIAIAPRRRGGTL
jgi:NADH-quinone oxidoreductase subunit J